MKKKFILLILLYISTGNAVWSQQLSFSDNVEISLLTASSGEKLYSIFGHNALRVKDATTGIDAVFNYGTFNFNAPDFYINFARGRMNYCLGVESYTDFFTSYSFENRGIQEQIFEMDSAEKRFIIQFLENNLKPENVCYPYHFFEDNCATRIRDLLQLAYKGIEFPPTKESITYRDLVHIYLKHRPWEKLGIDIVLGVSADKNTDVYEQMFLPDYLFDAFANTKYNGRPVIRETKAVFIPEESGMQTSMIITPMFICCCIFILSVFCIRKKGAKVFDFALFLLMGAVGIIVFLLWFFTDHADMRNNFNIIWAIPTHLIMAFFMFSNKRSKFYRKYFLVTFILSVSLLIAWTMIPQKLNPALIPLVASISLRSLWNSFSNPIRKTQANREI